MPSPYEATLDLDGLHPRLRAYFGAIPEGSVGRGLGVFDSVGTPRRWLWPVLSVLGRQGVVFPYWGGGVPFTVVNTPAGGSLAGARTFHFPQGDRTMCDRMTVVDGRLVDDLGRARRYRTTLAARVVDGALTLRSERFRLRIGRMHLPFPGRVELVERWDDGSARQHVSVTITVPVVGRVYEYAGFFTYEVTP